ncbi:GntR family transcriptional regulator [Streptomyces sp. NPDC058045]|uniref:GntR family transcriptional regulator n=1 Tax=Streptomyces sp. NPDC058045 TaxID=3346311 RepID=UPI0036EC2DB9
MRGVSEPVSAKQAAYELLRDRLITLAVAPGSPLDESALSRELGFGLTPIRDAVKRLALEHLVVVYPRRGTFATEVNLADELWLSEIRGALEALAAELAAVRAGDKERQELRRHADALRTETRPAKVNELDAAFHRTLYRATHNPFLETALNQYLNLNLRLWYYCRDRLGPSVTSAQHHSEIAEAIASRDPEAAQHHIRAHLDQSSRDIRGVM